MRLYPLDAEQPEALQGEKLMRVVRLCASLRQVKFYQSPEWRHKRAAVITKHNGECEMHRRRGSYARAEMVHHVWYLDKHPELALAEFYYSGGVKHMQLMPLCHECHEEMHGHRHAKKREPITSERW